LKNSKYQKFIRIKQLLGLLFGLSLLLFFLLERFSVVSRHELEILSLGGLSTLFCFALVGSLVTGVAYFRPAVCYREKHPAGYWLFVCMYFFGAMICIFMFYKVLVK